MTPSSARLRRRPLLLTGLWIGATLLVVSPSRAHAQTATAMVTFEVRAIREISLSGDPRPLTITHATAGSAPVETMDEGTTWSLTTNEAGSKVTGSLDAELPPGVTLSVALAAPPGGASAGAVTVSTEAREFVTAIEAVGISGLGVTYSLSGTTEAGVVPAGTRTLTFTLTAGT